MKTTTSLFDLFILAKSEDITKARNAFGEILMRLDIERKTGFVFGLIKQCRYIAYKRQCIDKIAFAEELHQHALAIALEKMDSFVPMGETEADQLKSFLNWLIGIAKLSANKLLKTIEPERFAFHKKTDEHWKQTFRAILKIHGQYSDQQVEGVMDRTYPPSINKMPFRIDMNPADMRSPDEENPSSVSEDYATGVHSSFFTGEKKSAEETQLAREEELLSETSVNGCEHSQEWNVADELFAELKKRHTDLSELDDLQRQILLKFLNSLSPMHRECIEMYLKYKTQKATTEDLDNFCAKWKIKRGTPRVIFGRKVKQLRRKYEKLKKAHGL